MRRAFSVVLAAATAVLLGTQPAGAAPIANSITGLTVTPTGSTATECTYDVTVDFTHHGPVHVDALADAGDVNYGGGNIDVTGTGSFTFSTVVSLPKGVTATFFADMAKHRGRNTPVMLDFVQEATARTCS